MSEAARLDWIPGVQGPKGDRGNIEVVMREMAPADIWVVQRILRAAGQPTSSKFLLRACKFHGMTARVAVRNQRHPVGVCISSHTPYLNRVLRYWTHDVLYPSSQFPKALLLLATWEKPEVPTYLAVDKTSKLNDRLRTWGWELDGIDDDGTNTWKARPWYDGTAPARPQDAPAAVPGQPGAGDGEVRGGAGGPPAGPDG